MYDTDLQTIGHNTRLSGAAPQYTLPMYDTDLQAITDTIGTKSPARVSHFLQIVQIRGWLLHEPY